MKWRFVIALTLLASGFGGLTDARAADAAKERSIDELTVTAEIARDGDFMAYGFDALWMMAGSTLVRVGGQTNAVGDIPVPETTRRVRGLAIGEGAVWIPDAVSGTRGNVLSRFGAATWSTQVAAEEGCWGSGLRWQTVPR